jgi:7-cyano-7-deazaguanine reductase
VKKTKLPLGRETDYPQNYAPDTLFPIARAESREPLGIVLPLPFSGVDVWNAWELTWLDRGGRPRIATAEIRVPADSPNLIESKSLKLYLGSFAMTEFANDEAVVTALAKDLSAAAGAGVEVELNPDVAIGELEGDCIDAHEVVCDEARDADPRSLQASNGDIVHESLHSHLLRSLCPVTAQPDIASLVVNYVGPRIDRASLLRYVVSFRQHQDFHEACVERMFVDILRRCRPQALSVYARYTRRGGIDINPYRSTGDERPPNTRLWRQ